MLARAGLQKPEASHVPAAPLVSAGQAIEPEQACVHTGCALPANGMHIPFEQSCSVLHGS